MSVYWIFEDHKSEELERKLKMPIPALALEASKCRMNATQVPSLPRPNLLGTPFPLEGKV